MIDVLLLYDIRASWERDYIRNEHFSGLRIKFILFGNRHNHLPRLIYKYKARRTALVVSSRSNYDLLDLVITVKPDIFVYLSDEDLGITEPTEEQLKSYNDTRSLLPNIAKYTKLILHQYNQYEIYKTNNKFIHIPTGYVTGMLGGISFKYTHVRPVSNRAYIAAFVGQIKSDRMDMMREFNLSFDNRKLNFITGETKWKINKLNISPKKLYSVYSDAIFVPVGRGQTSLSCFRVSEAFVCGAIPIVVGEDSEINNTFWFQGNKPPMITATSWKDACLKCKQLLNDKAALQQKQDECLDWFKKYNQYINTRVKETLRVKYRGGSGGLDHIGFVLVTIVLVLLCLIIKSPSTNVSNQTRYMRYLEYGSGVYTYNKPCCYNINA